MTPSRRLGYTYAFSTSLCFAFVPILAKYGLQKVHFLSGITIALTVGVALYTIFMLGTHRARHWPELNSRALLGLFLYAASNVAAIVANYAAISKTLVSIAAPVSATYPAFTLLFAALFLRKKETIGARLIAATIAIILGTTLVVR